MLPVLLLMAEDGFAGSFVKCLETELYWKPSAEKFSSYVDVSHFDDAVLALSDGKAYSWSTLIREGGDAGSASAAFLAASYEWETFIPKFQARLKELSMGKAELVSISPEGVGAEVSRSDARYFKLVRRMPRGTKEKIVMLTREGFKDLPKSAGEASLKTPTSSKKRVDLRSLARAARRSGAVLIAKDVSPEYAKVASEEAQQFWAPVLRHSESREDANHLDAAAFSIDLGKSYSGTTLREQNFEDEGARSAFRRISNDWDEFVPMFQRRVKAISKGKSELIPITSKEAGVDISGYGRFFKLVRQTYRGPQEDIVWLTPEGFDVLARPGKSRP